MPAFPANIVVAPTALLNLPDLSCFTSFQEFLAALPQFLVALVPTNITNVVIGNIQPQDTQRNTLWVRKDNSGTFIGLFVYSSGIWSPIWPVPNGVYGTWRLSTDPFGPPAGYTRLDNVVGVPPAVVAARIATWTVDGANPTEYLFYEVQYTGL